MTGARDITQLCCSPNLAGIVANKIEQSFYSVYSYSGIESIERGLNRMLQLSQSLCFDQQGLIFLLLTVVDLVTCNLKAKNISRHPLFI